MNMGGAVPLPIAQLMQKMQASLSYSRNGNVLRLNGPGQVADALEKMPTLQEFVAQYGRLMYVGGAERIPVMTFPEEEEKDMPFVLVSATWFLENAGFHTMLRTATARIDADVDGEDGMFQTRMHMQKPVQRTEFFAKCPVIYCKYGRRDGELSGMCPTGRTAYELFYTNNLPLDAASIGPAIEKFSDVMSEKAIGRISMDISRAIGFALDNDLCRERDRIWVAIPRVHVWGMADFDPDDFDCVDVAPPRVHPAISALDLLRVDDPSIPSGAARFTVRCDDLDDVPLVYTCRKSESAGGAEHSACDNARMCFKKTGLMVFARDLGGYPVAKPGEPEPDADDVKAHRSKKMYFCANWRGLEGILRGEITDGFETVLPDRFGRRKENMGRCVYEYLMEQCMNYPYGDLDCDLEYNPEMLQNADECTRIAIEFHMYMLCTLFGAQVVFEDYFISSADISKVTTHPDGTRTVEGKASRHFICKKYAFYTMLDQRMFINWCYTTLFAIFRKAEADPAACTEQELRFTRLRITDNRGAMRSFIDFGVYKSGCQLFRLFGNSKAAPMPFRPQRRLVVSNINRHPIPEGATEMDIVRMSMVQRVPIDFPDNLLLEFRIENNEQIPMMTYEMDEDGAVVDFHIWNPGDDTSKRPRQRRKRKNHHGLRVSVDLSKRYRVSGASGSGETKGGSARATTGPVERKVLQFVAEQPWAKLWEDSSHRFGARISTGARVAIQTQGSEITMIRITPKIGHECPCLVKWTLDESDRQTREGDAFVAAEKPTRSVDCPGHGNCPVSILIRPGTVPGRWGAVQRCEFNCKQRATAAGKRVSYYLGPVPAQFIRSLQAQGQ